MKSFFRSFLPIIHKLFIFSLGSFPSFSSLQEREEDKKRVLMSELDPNVLQRQGDYYYLGKKVYSDPLRIKKAWTYDRETQTRYYYGQEQEVTDDNYRQAVTYYKEAARHNHPISLWCLGECYELGRGVRRDYQKALTYYTHAADQGYAPAQFSIGFMYQEGLGIPQAIQQAIRWYRLAAQREDPQASFRLSLYAIRNHFPLSTEKILELLLSAAHHGYAPAQNTLGLFYRDIKSYEQETMHWFGSAAEQGYKPAQINLGDVYLEGKVVPQDEEQALKWYEAADLFRNIKERLHFLKEHHSLYSDDLNAIRWYLWLASQGNITAQAELGYIYYEGRGVPKNFEQAFKWFHLAADQGDAQARDILDKLYKEVCRQ